MALSFPLPISSERVERTEVRSRAVGKPVSDLEPYMGMAGLYRIFVQVKRKGNVETGVFDADVK
jgi:hypothetical protein